MRARKIRLREGDASQVHGHAGDLSRGNGKAENMLRDTLKSLFAVAEAYPDLKANANFLQLQSQLHELENSIESARSITMRWSGILTP